ncbi:hypothetical protein ACIP69_18015 [Streptomyces hygroscopicus]|uniref:hypothetical protein n=1 Tax=Streptomyces hygroscopicus TaxID=1912 RepID=UPI0038166DA3
MSIIPSASRRKRRPTPVAQTRAFKELVEAIDTRIPSEVAAELLANFRDVVRAELLDELKGGAS